jgi:hypothetical protein
VGTEGSRKGCTTRGSAWDSVGGLRTLLLNLMMLIAKSMMITKNKRKFIGHRYIRNGVKIGSKASPDCVSSQIYPNPSISNFCYK